MTGCAGALPLPADRTSPRQAMARRYPSLYSSPWRSLLRRWSDRRVGLFPTQEITPPNNFLPTQRHDLLVPDHTKISRPATCLAPVPRTALLDVPVTLVIDSTGLKVYGAGEWHRDKYGIHG